MTQKGGDMGWIKPPEPFIDPACATLGAASQFDYEIASNFSAQDDTEGEEAPCGFDSATLTLAVSS